MLFILMDSISYYVILMDSHAYYGVKVIHD